MGMLFKKKVKRKVKFREKLKLWRLRESKVKQDFAEGVNNKWVGNEDWCGLKRKLLDLQVKLKSVVILKANPDISKRGDGIKMWMWLCVKRESYLVIWKQSRNEEDRRKYCETKKDAKRVVYMVMDQTA